jgi:hypothetical protein
MCILIILFVFSFCVYAIFVSEVGLIQSSAKVEQYVASGQILRISVFGIINPYLNGLASAGLLINSGFAWASATGSLCKSRKEAVLSGVFSFSVYTAFASDVGLIQGSAKVEQYVASGQILRISAFGIINPYLNGLASAGLLINSGFAWASATGSLCKSRKEAVLSGFFSSLLFYISTAVVVCLMLLSIDHVAGKEVPMLAVIQYFLPELSVVYSLIIMLAIFSTISGRLFLIGERYGRGNKKLSLAIATGITIFASVGASFISFSKISNMMFSIFGTVGIVLGVVVLTRFCISKAHKK